MIYSNSEWTIGSLISSYEKEELNLNPPYQRHDIWTPIAKKRLIDSIKIGYPLPSFFLHKRENSKYDVVDGQQRTRTLLGYIKNLFPDLNKKYFSDSESSSILDYRISVVIIETETDESIEDFYYRVNNYGSKLNRQETLKAQYSGSLFLKLVEELAESNEFIGLGLFTSSATSRMIDIDFISELLAQVKYGVTDKKHYVDKLYDVIASEEEFNELRNGFYETIRIFQRLNTVFAIRDTRYKQKNDFYTLFGFVNKRKSLSIETFTSFYKLLVVIGDDILPSNSECISMQDYAFNCISQSNSSEARKARLSFFVELLTNETAELNETQEDVSDYYSIEYTPYLVEGYTTLDYQAINSTLDKPKTFAV
ncbi:DUF262 domain-containing protein [Hymenobacter arizonensis]|uniref:GmrSD restriction endonucleases N-terminal domain-containing protein n=1 Tax=Hymenobacter arizonensis TaxID=1227077 RepID=A0A1I5Z8V9_HYMAR|nr:DUF262 domain-containing protein [Hymenobacter arizonensis]SFQ52537.1 Protein of unknown function DUF262 [Hymenobacter arizonensis]